MPLTHTKDLFAKALKGKYALGAFNVNNMELLQAIVEACEEEKAPVMLQISRGARQYANPVYLKKLIEAAVSLSNIPIAVHLDHGDTFELCKECIDGGKTFVDAFLAKFECVAVVEVDGNGDVGKTDSGFDQLFEVNRVGIAARAFGDLQHDGRFFLF